MSARWFGHIWRKNMGNMAKEVLSGHHMEKGNEGDLKLARKLRTAGIEGIEEMMMMSFVQLLFLFLFFF